MATSGTLKTGTWNVLRRTMGLFAPYRWRLLILVLLIVITTGLEVLPVLLVKEIVDQAVYQTGDNSRITWLFFLMLAMYVSGALLGVVRGYLNQLIGQGVVVDLRERLFGHLQQLSVRFYTNTRAGEILARVTTDVQGVQEAVTGTFTMLLINMAILANAIGLMFFLDPRLALLAALVLPIWVYPTLRIGDVMRGLQKEWQEENADMTSHLTETLSISGTMLVRTFGRQGFEAQRFDRANKALRALSIKRFVAGRWFNTSTQLFGSFAVAFVYWYGGQAVVSGEIPTVGVVVAFAALSQRVFGPFRQLARIQTTALTSLALFERIFEYMDLPLEVAEAPDARSIEKIRGSIVFEDIHFSYTGDNQLALEAVRFEVQPGQMVALVGPSGAGKTTIGYLLQRFYDPQRGRVLLDGHDLRELDLDTVSSAVGSVMQETYLFHTELSENIRYGRLEATDSEIMAAASAAGLADLIRRLPEGLQTVVGERGYRLSGGEKQRVAIARAILKDPPVLLLDEATASLDARLEREIRESIDRLARGRTSIVVAHRLSTVLNADMIHVMDHGRIVESGTHTELLALNGLYAALYREQLTSADAPKGSDVRANAAVAD